MKGEEEGLYLLFICQGFHSESSFFSSAKGFIWRAALEMTCVMLCRTSHRSIQLLVHWQHTLFSGSLLGKGYLLHLTISILFTFPLALCCKQTGEIKISLFIVDLLSGVQSVLLDAYGSFPA